MGQGKVRPVPKDHELENHGKTQKEPIYAVPVLCVAVDDNLDALQLKKFEVSAPGKCVDYILAGLCAIIHFRQINVEQIHGLLWGLRIEQVLLQVRDWREDLRVQNSVISAHGRTVAHPVLLDEALRSCEARVIYLDHSMVQVVLDARQADFDGLDQCSNNLLGRVKQAILLDLVED